MGVTILADNQATYEGLFILDANRLARDREGLPREVNDLIESAGGVIEVSRLWEERRLAYPIKGQRKGAYWITYFRIDKQAIGGLTRQCELKESILRQLFVRLPDSLVEPILEHAKGTQAAESSSAKEPASEVQKVEEVAAS